MQTQSPAKHHQTQQSLNYILPEVLSGLGHSLAVKTNHNATELLIAVGDVEVDLSSC